MLLNSFRRLFSKSQNRKARRASGSPRLELFSLEQRIVPTVQPYIADQVPENNLVFISSDLLEKVPQQELANASVVTLDLQQDVISQISKALANRTGLETLRIISHGGDGTLNFGSQVVNQDALSGRGEEIATWAKAMAPGADLLLYGCSVAQSDVGQDFVNTLSRLTGADVAASNNPTGAGGDTTLEYDAGVVTASLQASSQAWNETGLQLPQSGDFTYTSSGSAITITGYTGAGAAVSIPATIDNLPVTTIGGSAFLNKTTISSITIPSGVTSIGTLTFYNCTSLTSITLPSNLTSIGAYAFGNCTSLTSITLPSNLTSIGAYAFVACTRLTSVNIPNLITSISEGAFQSCTSLPSITIPSSVTSIGNAAFNGCTSLPSITIPSSVTSIGNDAFQSCTSLPSITIPSSVTSIGYNAFNNCTLLDTIIIPNSVTSIGTGAFGNCTRLTSVTIGTGLTSIASDAFNGCTSLPSINIPSNVTSIGNNAFRNCTSLTSITIPSSVTSIGNEAFGNCTSLPSITIPSGVTSIGTFTFYNCTSLTSITIPSSVTSIGTYAFGNCTNLTSITLPSNLTSIGAYAFVNCTRLASVYFLGNAPSLGTDVFINDSNATLYYLTGKSGWTNPFGGRPSAMFTLGPIGSAISSSSIGENSGIGTAVGTLSSTSIITGTAFTYTLVSGTGDTDNTSFTITGDSLNLNFIPDFKTKTSYTVRIRSADASNVYFEKAFVITITDENDAPTVVALTNTTTSLPENTSTTLRIKVADIVVTDDAMGTNVISLTGAGAGNFEVDGASLYLKAGVALNYETTPSYGVTVSVLDSGISGSTAVTVNYTLTVTDVNEAPVITSGSTGSVAENAPTSTVIYTAAATDVDTSATVTYSIKSGLSDDESLVLINGSTGAVTLLASANFEVKSSYTFTVVATDNGTPAGLTAEKSVTVSVTDVNEAPVITSGSTGTVAENAATSTVIYTAVATDVDASATVTYSIKSGVVGDDESLVSIDASSGVVTLRASANFEVKSSYTFTVVATDNGTPAGLTAEKVVTVSVTDVNENLSPTPTPTPTPTAPMVVGTPQLPSSSGSSTVTFYNPITGEETGTAVPFPGFNGPVKVVSGDWNNDGVADIIAGAGFGGGPAIAILDSQTGKVMESFFAFDPAFTGGVFVAVQDTNGDGIMDIIASAGPGGGPEVRIFDGNNLNVLRSFYAYAEDFSGGVSVASVDFNNDGILDLVTGAGPGGAPHVKVFDGATNAIISQWYAYPVSFTGGVFVAVGDIGNDGTFEVVTGAGQGGAPIVAVWDPFTGALLAQFMAYAEGFTGGVRVGINDGNSDGVPDILTGAGPGGAPQVNVFSFPALDLLFSFYSGDPTNTGGVFVS